MSPIHTGNDVAKKFQRMRALILSLVVIIVLALSATPVLVSTYLNQQIDEVQFEIACSSAESNIQQLRALQAVSRELGIPGDFPVPELPPECEVV